jgi:hypothetical protein
MTMEKQPFDILKASFWLIASIIWAQILVGASGFVVCSYGILSKNLPIGVCKDVAPNIMELLVGGLAVALAFSGRAK